MSKVQEVDALDTFFALEAQLKTPDYEEKLRALVVTMKSQLQDTTPTSLQRKDLANIYNSLLSLSYSINLVKSRLDETLKVFGPALPIIFNAPENHSRTPEPLDDGEELTSGEDNQ